jgi:hypothetical protein
MDDAGKAMAALERRGIDGSKISLLGRKPDETREEIAHEKDVSGRDAEVAEDVAKSAGIGTAVGGAAGFLAGLATFAIPGVGPVLGTGIWVAALAGAIGGGSVGGVAGGIAALPIGRDWELAEESLKQGRAIVAVHTSDPAEIRAAIETLRSSDALTVERLDEEGRQRAA